MVTLDGYFEGKDAWQIDRLVSVWGDELERSSLEQAVSASFTYPYEKEIP